MPPSPLKRSLPSWAGGEIAADAAARLPHCELLMFGKEARHEVLREEDAVRDKVLGAIDDFLDRKVPRRD